MLCFMVIISMFYNLKQNKNLPTNLTQKKATYSGPPPKSQTARTVISCLLSESCNLSGPGRANVAL